MAVREGQVSNGGFDAGAATTTYSGEEGNSPAGE